MYHLVGLHAPHVRSTRDVGDSRALRTAALLLAATLSLVACTGPDLTEDAPGLSAELGARVGEFLDRYDEYDKVRAVLVYEDGVPVLELSRGEGADGYLNQRSVTKSVVSTLIGIAIDDGLIAGVDTPLGELLPAYRDAMSTEVAAIPLEAILTHTAGFAGAGSAGGIGELDFPSSADWVGAIIADRVARGRGDGSFEYSNAGAHLLAAVLHQATGGDVLGFARARLFDPLGIDSEPAWTAVDEGTPEERLALAGEYVAAGFAWPTDPQGVPEGQSLLKLRPADMAKLGQLFLDEGAWDGRQVVSAEWVEAATARHVATGSTPNGYGYQWWIHTDDDGTMFVARGYGGNLIAVVPDRRIVAVIAASFEGIDPLENAQKFDDGEAITLVQYVILAAPE